MRDLDAVRDGLAADLARWEQGEMGVDEVAARHPESDAAALVETHAVISYLVSPPAAEPGPSWEALAARLPDREREPVALVAPARRRRLLQRRLVAAFLTGAVMAPATAAAHKPDATRRVSEGVGQRVAELLMVDVADAPDGFHPAPAVAVADVGDAGDTADGPGGPAASSSADTSATPPPVVPIAPPEPTRVVISPATEPEPDAGTEPDAVPNDEVVPDDGATVEDPVDRPGDELAAPAPADAEPVGDVATGHGRGHDQGPDHTKPHGPGGAPPGHGGERYANGGGRPPSRQA